MTKTKKTIQDAQIKYIEEIVKLEKNEEKSLSFASKIAKNITDFSGSMKSVFLHVLWFSIWIIVNTNLTGIKPFDPFPFSLLTMIVSLEAIILTSLVLLTENKQSQQADKRAKIDLVVNMIAESENTTTLQMLKNIQQKLGIKSRESDEAKSLFKRTEIKRISNEIEKAEHRIRG